MPDGQPAPVSHQHADDTSLHVLQPSPRHKLAANLRKMTSQMCSLRANCKNALEVSKDDLAAVDRIMPLLSKISQIQSDVDDE